MSVKRYDVCVPRKYLDRKDGQEKTTFWRVGVGFPLRERDGVSIELYTNVLPTKRLVLFAVDPQQGTDEPGPDSDGDDIPY